jgi:hypothetical protein
MISLTSLTSNQLKRAASIQEKIESLHHELAGLLGASTAATNHAVAAPKTGRIKISAAGIARIKAAQKLRWAKVRAGKPSAPAAKKKTRKMSPAARAKIAAVAKARWAAIKAAGKKRL